MCGGRGFIVDNQRVSCSLFVGNTQRIYCQRIHSLLCIRLKKTEMFTENGLTLQEEEEKILLNEIRLPKFRKSVVISFSSLRMSLGQNLGVEEIDKFVERKCYREKILDGYWNWKIKGFNQLPMWDKVLAEIDQEILGEIGDDLRHIEIMSYQEPRPELGESFDID